MNDTINQAVAVSCPCFSWVMQITEKYVDGHHPKCDGTGQWKALTLENINQAENARDELKPCPFCGSKADVNPAGQNDPYDEDYVQCSNMDCVLFMDFSATIPQWNTRAARSPHTPEAVGSEKEDESIYMTPELVANLIECVTEEFQPHGDMVGQIKTAINEWFAIAGEKPDGPGYDGFRYE